METKYHITPQNLAAHELIGLEVRVKNARDPSLSGLKGRVVWETMHTLTLRTGTKEKRIAKHAATFVFTLPDGSRVPLEGELLNVRPQARTKLWRKKR